MKKNLTCAPLLYMLSKNESQNWIITCAEFAIPLEMAQQTDLHSNRGWTNCCFHRNNTILENEKSIVKHSLCIEYNYKNKKTASVCLGHILCFLKYCQCKNYGNKARELI